MVASTVRNAVGGASETDAEDAGSGGVPVAVRQLTAGAETWVGGLRQLRDLGEFVPELVQQSRLLPEQQQDREQPRQKAGGFQGPSNDGGKSGGF